MLPPRPLLAACVLLLGGLAWSVHGAPAPRVEVADAARWEGQSVTLEGWAQRVVRGADGVARLQIVEDGAAVAVRVAGESPIREGERLVATGRLSRSAGALALLVDDPTLVRAVASPAAERPSWQTLAEDPNAWTARRITLAGELERGHLVGEGASLRAGGGPWPRSGLVEASGLLRYEASCLCHVLDADGVRPWTP
jgi:hypothetical protein